MNLENIQFLQQMLPYLKWAAIASVGLYVLAAFGINVLAAKLHHRHAWMAWIPVVNLYLLCRMAQVTPFLIVFALIPVVNVPVLSYFGVRIARRLDKSAVLGAMFGIPILGAFVPLLLSAGGTAPERPAGMRPASISPFASAALAASAVIVCLAALGGAYSLADRMTQDVAPTAAQAAATLPKRVAGTLTEFPIDTEKTKPARPTKVVTQSFAAANGAKNASAGVMVKADQLPPWIPPESLPKIANDATSADYISAPADTPVSVVSLSLREGDSGALTAPTSAEIARFSPKAKVSGIDLKSADGTAYRGYKVSSDDAAYYMLRRADTNTAVIISTNAAGGLDVAARLAGNVGNGEGLLEYENYRGVFGRLPAAPAGTALNSFMTFTSDDIAGYVAQLTKAAESGEPDLAQFGDMIDLARKAVPSSASFALYSTSSEDRFFAAGTMGYSAASDSWMVFAAVPEVAKAALAAIGTETLPIRMRTISVGGATAYAADMEMDGVSGGGILLRQGASLVGLAAVGTSSDGLLPWAESYLSGNGVATSGGANSGAAAGRPVAVSAAQPAAGSSAAGSSAAGSSPGGGRPSGGSCSMRHTDGTECISAVADAPKSAGATRTDYHIKLYNKCAVSLQVTVRHGGGEGMKKATLGAASSGKSTESYVHCTDEPGYRAEYYCKGGFTGAPEVACGS